MEAYYAFSDEAGQYENTCGKRFLKSHPYYVRGTLLVKIEDNSGQPQNHPQAVDDSEQLVFCIPWGHNRTIIDKCKDNPAKALFFVKETISHFFFYYVSRLMILMYSS